MSSSPLENIIVWLYIVSTHLSSWNQTEFSDNYASLSVAPVASCAKLVPDWCNPLPLCVKVTYLQAYRAGKPELFGKGQQRGYYPLSFNICEWCVNHFLEPNWIPDPDSEPDAWRQLCIPTIQNMMADCCTNEEWCEQKPTKKQKHEALLNKTWLSVDLLHHTLPPTLPTRPSVD